MAMSRVLSAMQSGGRSTLNHGCSCTCRQADPVLQRCPAFTRIVHSPELYTTTVSC